MGKTIMYPADSRQSIGLLDFLLLACSPFCSVGRQYTALAIAGAICPER
jgi:hypothetical protein